MSFSDQKVIKDGKGDPVGLTGADYAKHAALTRGLKAMDVEVKGRRGAGQEKDDRDQSSDQSQGKSAAQGKSSERAPARSVSEENSVDHAFPTLSDGFQSPRGGCGRSSFPVK